MKRYAIVRNTDTQRQLEAYLPDNYRIIFQGYELPNGLAPGRSRYAHTNPDESDRTIREVFVIQGEDRAGWTLDAYVKPRLASGLIWAEEIDLSHPIMKLVPA